jgi:succinate-semialdehyde dehydrogenase/glutarate-semialdehyde dehydrogenase
MINADAVQKVQELVDDAKACGARVRCGGQLKQGGGLYYPPTVLDRVPTTAKMFHEEIFGPVAPIYVFDDEEEAVTLANDTEYGLVAYLYTRDLSRGLRVSTALEAGMVALNRGLVSDPAAPFGGVKQSGLGREGAQHGILEFLEPKYIATSWGT